MHPWCTHTAALSPLCTSESIERCTDSYNPMCPCTRITLLPWVLGAVLPLLVSLGGRTRCVYISLFVQLLETDSLSITW